MLLCAAAADREALLPDEEGSAPANEGSNAHWLLEQGLCEGAWPPAIMAFGPEKLKEALPYPDFDLPDNLIEQAKDCYEYVQRRVAEMKPANARAEIKVDPQLYTGRTDSTGSVDVAIISDAMLEIVDLKTGGCQVEADASQLRIYGLGTMAEYADKLSGLAPFQTIRLTVFQPKRPGMDTIERSVDFTQEELIAWATDTWVPAANASDDPNARATPTEDGCKYCKAQKHGVCPEYTASVQGAAATLFKPVEQAGTGLAPPAVDPMMSEFDVNSLNVEQVGLFLEIWPLLKARGKDIEERGVALLKERTAIPGFKLVRGNSNRKWLLDDEEQAKKFKNMKLTLKQIFVEKIRSPAQMLALDIPTAKKELLKKHIGSGEGKLTLVPTSDKRVDAVPAVEFQPVEPVAQQPVAKEAAPAVDMGFLSL